MIRTGLTREQRAQIKADQEAQARAYFDRLFPGVMDSLDALTEMTRSWAHDERPLYAHYKNSRPTEEYQSAINRLCGNVTLDDAVLDRNIAEATISVKHRGAVA